MKKTITLMTTLGMGIVVSNAQITITPNDVALSGKVIYQATDTIKSITSAGLNPGPSGANKTWNFSNLLVGTTDTLYVTNPAWLSHGTSFPTSNLAILFPDGTEYYLNNSATGLMAQGAYGDPTGQGAQVVQINPNEMITSFPNTYNTSFQNTSKIDLKAPFTGFPGVDSVRFKEIKTKDILTDGWGSITTPLGTNQCIRQRGKVLTHDSIWLHTTGPIPPAAWTFFNETMDSAWHFAWWGNNLGYSILEFDSTEADTIRNITWLKALPVAGSVHESAAFKGLNIYPNPSSGNFTLTAPGLTGTAVAEIFTAVGDKVLSLPVTNCDKNIDLKSQPAGVYFLKVTSKEGTATRKIVINK